MKVPNVIVRTQIIFIVITIRISIFVCTNFTILAVYLHGKKGNRIIHDDTRKIADVFIFYGLLYFT